ncbi:hypothetical protein BAUCODRAFT_68711 [Baudoinia panamericana UAMH 10762]|uniref:prephenate dehydratase n=1 Tax=Baudoinia panamericana (strain UAMH 10762) TaxID=717646 RepID=M2NDB3_BAUPA|nr:uncharacterized protein BAUCODRAFT_68711 [Baudoinia panamericana UAMH 10762]EMC96910.1 hypothetical protein BAUCODRAFT_68711 [Baudoinia panamericana UAMH 10762]
MATTEDVVAFLGPKASYTHQATLTRFPDSKYTVKPQTTIEDIFAAVQNGTASHGVVPFENSSNGSVVFTLDLFADLNGRYPDILVCGEVYLPVHHCLLGQATPTKVMPTPNQPRVRPQHDIKHIKQLYSHPQAWGQCKIFLSAYLKGVERQDVSSTSKAAELVAHDTKGTCAAISSKIAADLNGLDVLAEGIEDNEGNTTRFFVIRRRDALFDGTNAQVGEGTREEHCKTLVSFTVDHGAPGALADCLATFKRHDLNLTSINTRPSGEAAWHYVFFVELVGRKLPDGEGGAVNDALLELTTVAKGWRWLGSWVDELRA